MIALELGRLVAAGVAPTQARLILEPLASACTRFDINTPARIGGFLAQCIVESQGFTRFEENLYYTTPERIKRIFPSRVADLEQAALLARNPKALANCVYAGKNGNGNPLSGDGWNYRGRGAIQLTGLGNYADATNETGRPYVKQPDLVAEPPDALLTAAWYWHTHKLNLLADSAQWDSITRAVNGPRMEQAAWRKQQSELAAQAFH